MEFVMDHRSLLRSRAAVSAVFFINGVTLASWVPHIPVVKAHHGINDAELGVVLLCMAAGAVTALSVAGWLVTRFGSRRMTSIAAIGLCTSLTLPILAPSTVLLGAALFVLGAFNGTLDVSMNAQAVEVEALHKRPIMSSFHGLFSLGGLAGAGGAAVFTWLGATPVEHVLVTTAVGLALVAASLPLLLPGHRSAGGSTPLFVRPTGPLRALGLLAFAALLAEGSMADWSAVYLHDSLGASAHVAAVGFAAFSLTMAAGRLGGDVIVRLLGGPIVLRASGILAAAGLGVALLIGTPAAAIAGCGAVGLGIANVFPLLLSRAGHLPGIEPGRALAGITATGYCGFLAGPPLIGLAAEMTTLPLALGIVVAFCAMIALLPTVSSAPDRGGAVREGSSCDGSLRIDPAQRT